MLHAPLIQQRKATNYLSLINSYPIAKQRPPEITRTAPEQGHLSKRFSVNAGKDNHLNFAELSFRMSFHSLEDNRTGFLQGAQINMGDIRIRAIEDQDTQLEQLDFIDIFSLTPRNDFFDPISWRVYSGLERHLTFGKDRLVTHVTAGGGVSYQLLSNNFSYAMARARLERNRGFDNTIEPAWGLMLGTLQHFNHGTARIELNSDHFANDEYRYRILYNHNFVISRNHSLLLTAKREKQAAITFSEFGIGYQYYF